MLKLIADAGAAIDGLQKAAAGVRDTGAAAKEAGANLAGFDAALAAVGEDGATVLGPPAIALQDLGISAQGAQGDVTLLGTELAAIGDDGATNLAPLRQGLLLVGDEAVIAGTDVTGLGALATLSGVNLTTLATGTLQAAQEPAHTGDVTNSAGSLALTIADNVVGNAKLAQMAASTLKGNNTGSTANAADLSTAQVKTLLAIAATDVSGLGALATLSGVNLSNHPRW